MNSRDELGSLEPLTPAGVPPETPYSPTEFSGMGTPLGDPPTTPSVLQMPQGTGRTPSATPPNSLTLSLPPTSEAGSEANTLQPTR